MPYGAPPPPPSPRPTGEAGLPPTPPGFAPVPKPIGSSGPIVGDVFVGANPPTQFPSTPVAESVVVEAYPNNVDTVFLGFSQGTQPFPLAPGAHVEVDPDNLSQLWLSGSNSADGVGYIGR